MAKKSTGPRPKRRKPVPRSKLAAFLTSPKTRNAALASLPIAYGFGYFLWSFYAVTAGLGFLPVAQARYLVAGLTFGLYFFVLLWTPLWIWSHLRRKDKQGRLGGYLPVIISLFVSYFATALLLGFGEIFQMVEVSGWEEWLVHLVPLGIAIMTLVAYGILAGFSWLKARASSTVHSFLDKEPGPSADGPSSHRFSVFYFTVLVFAMLLVSATVLLPAMRPEFGGAMAREAFFELPVQEVSTELQTVLWPNGVDPSQSVARTTKVLVYYYDGSSFLIRVPPSIATDDPLYELDRGIVHAVIWKD